jgi:hypothetical protein
MGDNPNTETDDVSAAPEYSQEYSMVIGISGMLVCGTKNVNSGCPPSSISTPLFVALGRKLPVDEYGVQDPKPKSKSP